jgi:HPt (histidine-containing phosphotransfer) domain-containing protein
VSKFNIDNAALEWGSDDEVTQAGEDLLSFVPPELFHLLPGFLARREGEVSELSELLRLRQFEGIRSVGHKLKGSGLGYGFQIITDLGRDLEQAAQDQDIEEIQLSIAKLKTFSKELKDLMTVEPSRK